MAASALEKSLIAKANKEYAKKAQGYFKTGPGEYSEGDQFLGIRVPALRDAVKQQRNKITLNEIIDLLQSDWHEVRMFALLAMVDYFERGTNKEKKAAVSAYLKNKHRINNWDLVDCSAYKITGPWFFEKDRTPLDKLVKANHMWSRRIAVLSTFHYIRQNDLDDTYRYAQLLFNDPEDLMHKASGWMLREAGKRDIPRLMKFLHRHAPSMPRTMLRYAIEKLPIDKKKRLMGLK